MGAAYTPSGVGYGPNCMPPIVGGMQSGFQWHANTWKLCRSPMLLPVHHIPLATNKSFMKLTESLPAIMHLYILCHKV